MLHHLLLPLHLLACGSTSTVREVTAHRLGVNAVEIKISVVFTSSPLALVELLVCHFISIWNCKLLVGCVCCGHEYFSSTWVSSKLMIVVGTRLLAACSNWLFPSRWCVWIILAYLGLVVHWVSNWVNIVIASIADEIRNLNISFVVYQGEHSIIKPLSYLLNDILNNVKLEHDFHDAVFVLNLCIGGDCLQSKVPNLLLLITEKLNGRVKNLVTIKLFRVVRN